VWRKPFDPWLASEHENIIFVRQDIVGPDEAELT
jgi:hypothetical protein